MRSSVFVVVLCDCACVCIYMGVCFCLFNLAVCLFVYLCAQERCYECLNECVGCVWVSVGECVVTCWHKKWVCVGVGGCCTGVRVLVYGRVGR